MSRKLTRVSKNELDADQSGVSRELLTMREAADELRIKYSTIRSWVSQGKLSYHKFCQRVMIPRTAIQDLLTSSFHEAKQPFAVKQASVHPFPVVRSSGVEPSA